MAFKPGQCPGFDDTHEARVILVSMPFGNCEPIIARKNSAAIYTPASLRLSFRRQMFAGCAHCGVDLNDEVCRGAGAGNFAGTDRARIGRFSGLKARTRNVSYGTDLAILASTVTSRIPSHRFATSCR